MKASKKYGAVIPAIAPTATIKYAGEDSLVKDSLPRVKTWIAQTPQGFEKKLILAAYQKAIRKGYFTPTDDSGLITNIGRKVKIIPGDYQNIKITFPIDIAMAEKLIEFRGKE